MAQAGLSWRSAFYMRDLVTWHPISGRWKLNMFRRAPPPKSPPPKSQAATRKPETPPQQRRPRSGLFFLSSQELSMPQGPSKASIATPRLRPALSGADDWRTAELQPILHDRVEWTGRSAASHQVHATKPLGVEVRILDKEIAMDLWGGDCGKAVRGSNLKEENGTVTFAGGRLPACARAGDVPGGQLSGMAPGGVTDRQLNTVGRSCLRPGAGRLSAAPIVPFSSTCKQPGARARGRRRKGRRMRGLERGLHSCHSGKTDAPGSLRAWSLASVSPC